MAEVQITFDNDTGWLEVDSKEAELTRRMYRSTEGEYLVNGQRVRLRDIVDLMREGGLAPGGHTIVGQGMVDSVLSLRGQERRAFIAAVSGIAPYEARRAEALQRLEQTRANVAEAQLVLNELEPRLRLLKRQSNMIENALDARTRLTHSLQWYYSQRWTQLTAETQSAKQAIATFESETASLRRQIDELQSEQRRLQAQADQAQRERQEARDQVMAAEFGVERCEMRCQATRLSEGQRRSELENLRRRIARDNDEAEPASALQAALARVKASRGRRTEVANLMAGRQAELTSVTASVDRLLMDKDALEKNIESLRDSIREEETELTRLSRQLKEMEELLVNAENRIPILEDATAKAQERLGELSVEADEAAQAEGSAKEALTASFQAAATARRLQMEAAGQVESVERNVQELRSRMEDLISRRPQGQIQPTLVETMGVAPSLGQALAAAISDLADTPSTPDKNQPGPRPAYEPTRAWRNKITNRLAEQGIHPIGWLDDHITFGDEASLIRTSLGAVLVLDSTSDMDSAWTSLSPAEAEQVGHPPLKLVDCSGNLRCAGAMLPEPTGARQSVRRELEITNLEEQLLPLEESLPGLQRAWEAESAAADKSDAQVGQAEADFQAAQLASSSAQAKLRRTSGEAEQLSTELTKGRERSSQLAESLTQHTEEVAVRERRLQDLREQLRKDEPDLERLKGVIVDRQARADELNRTIQGLEADRSVLDRQIELEQGECDRLARLEQRAREEQEREAELISRMERDHEAAMVEITAANEALEAARHQLEVSRRRLEEMVAEPLGGDGGQDEAVIQELRQRIETGITGKQREQSRLEQVETEMAVLVRDCGIDLHQHPQALNPGDAETELSDLDIRRLRIKAEQAEDIDPGVAAEYQTLAARRETLIEQIDDLQTAAEELESILREADREVRRRFRLTFSHVNDLFSLYFRQIFGGGSGALVLESADNIESVEIEAQLPGRRTRDLSGLSGGERTLVAGAFLFALLSAAPPPFCVLDEVDAALDETNVDRYLDVLQDLAKQTQFIVVTHNRATMAAANTLYGIILDADAGSRALSLRLDQALAG